MNAIFYLLEANAYLAILYGFYMLFLKKETFYVLNRIYFILAPLLAFILPSFRISGLQATELYTANSGGTDLAVSTGPDVLPGVLAWGYASVAVFFITRLGFQLFQVAKLIEKGEKMREGQVTLVKLEENTSSFSFLNYLFIKQGSENEALVMRHERVHIAQLHTADVLYYELIRALNWFNPLLPLMQRDLKAIHEFIADEQTSAGETNAGEYAMFLINNTGNKKLSALVNPIFNRSLLKERILKLGQRRSPRKAIAKYTLLVLLLPLLVIVTSSTFRKSYGAFDLTPTRIRPAAINTLEQNTLDTLKKKPVPLKPLKSVSKKAPMRLKSKPAPPKALKEIPEVEEVIEIPPALPAPPAPPAKGNQPSIPSPARPAKLKSVKSVSPPRAIKSEKSAAQLVEVVVDEPVEIKTIKLPIVRAKKKPSGEVVIDEPVEIRTIKPPIVRAKKKPSGEVVIDEPLEKKPFKKIPAEVIIEEPVRNKP